MIFNLLVLISAAFAAEPLRVVTTLPDLAELVREVGGNAVQVDSLLRGTEDAHTLEANPALIAQVRKADVVVFLGLELEMAWLPRVLSRTGQARIQPGGEGYCDASTKVEVLEIPTGKIDRSSGDVHRSGNPHYNLSPMMMVKASSSILDCLKKTLPAEAERMSKSQKDLATRLQGLKARIHQRLEPARNRKIAFMQYHKEFSYFFAEYGLVSEGEVEEKPGVPPSAAYLAASAKRAKEANVKLVLASLVNPPRHLRKFQEASGVAFVQVPTMVQKDGPANSIAKLQERLASAILDGL